MEWIALLIVVVPISAVLYRWWQQLAGPTAAAPPTPPAPESESATASVESRYDLAPVASATNSEAKESATEPTTPIPPQAATPVIPPAEPPPTAVSSAPALPVTAEPEPHAPESPPASSHPAPEPILPVVLIPSLPETMATEPEQKPIAEPRLPAPEQPTRPSVVKRKKRRPVPRITAVPAEQMRPLITAMIGGGGLLMVMTQLTSSAVPPEQRLPIYLLALLGAACFLLGGRALIRQSLPAWWERPLTWLMDFFGVAGWQVVALLLAPLFAWLAHLAAGDFLLARRAGISVAAWVIACSLAIIGLLPAIRHSSRERLPRLPRIDLILALLFFLLAFALRGIATDQFPNTFSGDEGSAALSSNQFLNGEANNLFTVGWFSFPSLFFALQSIGIAIDGQTIAAVRGFSALGGALTVGVVFWLGRSLFNRLTGVLAAAYLATSHYHIHMSRIALNNIWDGFFTTLAILGLWAGWKTGRRSLFLLCGMALGLGQYFYVSIRVVPILFLLWAAVAWWSNREKFQVRLPGLVAAAYLALVIFLPLALYFAGHPDEFRAPLNRVSIMGDWLEREMANSGRSANEILLEQTVAGILGFTHEPLRLLYNPGSPLLLTAAATLFILGIMWALLNFDLRYLLLLLPLLATVASNTFSQDSPASQRYVMAVPLVALLMAVPLAELSGWLRQLWPRIRQTAVVGVLLLMAVLMAIDLRYYFVEITDRYVLGGWNTEVATEIAYYLRNHPIPEQDVYFFGFPRMGYFSLSTIPYLAPRMHGEEVVEPLTAAPGWAIDGPSIFMFLPERLNELPFVRERFPDGVYQEFLAPDGNMYFAVYEIGD